MKKAWIKTTAILLSLAMLFALPGCKKEESGKTPTKPITNELTKELTPEPTGAPEPTLETTPEPTGAGTEITPEPTSAAAVPVNGEHVKPAEEFSGDDKALVLASAEAMLASIGELETEEVTAKPLLWKVTDPDGAGVLYLLGSFHITDGRAYKVHPEIMKAYNEADALALEFDLLPYVSIQSKMLEMYSAYVDPEMKTIDTVIGKDLYEKAKDFLTQYNSYAPGLEYYKVYYWESLMTNIMYQLAGIGDVVGYDLYFDSLAYRDGKQVLEFESMQFQNDLMLSADDRMMIMTIEDMLDEEAAAESIEEAKRLYESWLAGDREALEGMIASDYTDPEFLALEEDLQENIKAYNKAMYEERNDGMAAGMKECIEHGGTTLCIVGTAHYIGEKGVVEQLRAAGYTVEQIVLE